MNLRILESNSKAICYLIESENEALILEAGSQPDDLFKALNSNLKKVAGCLVSHSHKPQTRFIKEYAEYFNIYSSAETLKYLNLAHYKKVKSIKENLVYSIGNFIVVPFLVKHDVKTFYLGRRLAPF